MPISQTHSDLSSVPQKLSKIETLRLARNYIVAMSQTLRENRPMELDRFVHILSRDLSQTTANLLNGTLIHNQRHKSFQCGRKGTTYSCDTTTCDDSYTGHVEPVNYCNSYYWNNYHDVYRHQEYEKNYANFLYWDRSGFNEQHY